ncbi:hypothetical protein AB0B50_27185 [Streptomyces sp. NPDC041068]
MTDRAPARSLGLIEAAVGIVAAAGFGVTEVWVPASARCAGR